MADVNTAQQEQEREEIQTLHWAWRCATAQLLVWAKKERIDRWYAEAQEMAEVLAPGAEGFATLAMDGRLTETIFQEDFVAGLRRVAAQATMDVAEP